MLREMLQKLSRNGPEGTARREAQSKSRQRASAYGSVSGKGEPVDSRSEAVKEKIEKSLG